MNNINSFKECVKFKNELEDKIINNNLYQFETYSGFYNALDEIVILISQAKNSIKNPKKYATYNKASLVLLCGKFEAFIENCLEEFGDYLLSHYNNQEILNLSNLTPFKDHLIKILIDDISNKIKHKNIDGLINKLVNLHSTKIVFNPDDLDFDSKFSYGKHGENEVKAILERFGVRVYIEDVKLKDFFNKFNSLSSIRNNILHQDATPSLTHLDVFNYLLIILEFSFELLNGINLLLIDNKKTKEDLNFFHL